MAGASTSNGADEVPHHVTIEKTTKPEVWCLESQCMHDCGQSLVDMGLLMTPWSQHPMRRCVAMAWVPRRHCM
ncbi:hypothetical protein E2562_003168 [Oryza meyeriana var. granulata]|uniref:Uncharacterized protein n=1 Tax=Oryza meyeriana var. granulata TaxID=110450 RepID=A0A6G1CK92_9ORYZ|nr:hypothetical protein E2562_036707 [Oryza meyeriana var. granulata]KAF0928346.1 hypothetical protein E2562_003168 [Oryza meyeriana var. granulata]